MDGRPVALLSGAVDSAGCLTVSDQPCRRPRTTSKGRDINSWVQAEADTACCTRRTLNQLLHRVLNTRFGKGGGGGYGVRRYNRFCIRRLRRGNTVLSTADVPDAVALRQVKAMHLVQLWSVEAPQPNLSPRVEMQA
jgi:hypothetical protein